jgi:hypothetical protein
MFIERCLPLFQRQCDRGLITQKEYEEIVDGTFLRDYLTKKVYDYQYLRQSWQGYRHLA